MNGGSKYECRIDNNNNRSSGTYRVRSIRRHKTAQNPERKGLKLGENPHRTGITSPGPGQRHTGINQKITA